MSFHDLVKGAVQEFRKTEGKVRVISHLDADLPSGSR